MILFLLLIPFVAECTSWSGTLAITQQNYQNLQIILPKISNSEVLYTIRDISTSGQFMWNISHQISQFNSTHSNLTFQVTAWPPELNNITYDILISQQNAQFRVTHFNITEYQTHVPYTDEDRKRGYSMVLFPTGFSKSTITMGFMWMAIKLAEIYVIHYMDHMMGDQVNQQNFGNNWVTFCIVYIKSSSYKKIIKLDKDNQYEVLKKNTDIPYVVGVQKIHHSNSKISVKQTVNKIIYSSNNVQASAVPLQISSLLDTRTYTIQQQISLVMKVLSFVVLVVLVMGIMVILVKNRSSFGMVWPTSTNQLVIDNSIKPRQLVQTD